MEFAIYYMIQNIDVQRKVQSEIDKVIGKNRLPTHADKNEYNRNTSILKICCNKMVSNYIYFVFTTCS